MSARGKIDTVLLLAISSKAKRLNAIWLRRRSINLIFERTKESSISSALDGIHVER
jgi:hypothetical protein